MGWREASQPDGASAGHPIEIAQQIYGFIARLARADIRGAGSNQAYDIASVKRERGTEIAKRVRPADAA